MGLNKKLLLKQIDELYNCVVDENFEEAKVFYDLIGGVLNDD